MQVLSCTRRCFLAGLAIPSSAAQTILPLVALLLASVAQFNSRKRFLFLLLKLTHNYHLELERWRKLTLHASAPLAEFAHRRPQRRESASRRCPVVSIVYSSLYCSTDSTFATAHRPGASRAQHDGATARA